MNNILEGKKTYITAIGAILAAAGAYMTGEMDLGEAIQLAFGALLAAFLRAGITTEATETKMAVEETKAFL